MAMSIEQRALSKVRYKEKGGGNKMINPKL